MWLNTSIGFTPVYDARIMASCQVGDAKYGGCKVWGMQSMGEICTYPPCEKTPPLCEKNFSVCSATSVDAKYGDAKYGGIMHLPSL